MSDRQPISDEVEALFRNVHPEFVAEGRLGSRAFLATKSSDFELSVCRSSLTAPADAYALHIGPKQLKSVGVWAITVGECKAQALTVLGDPVATPVPDAAHAVVDFTQISDKERKKLSQILRRHAEDRGRVYPSESSEWPPDSAPNSA